MAVAISRMALSLTPSEWTYQLFQPIGGVRQIVSPTRNVRLRVDFPLAFLAPIFTTISPAFFGARPVIQPDRGSMRTPSGKPVAAKSTGLSPVAETRKRIGLPGRTPKTSAPVIFGSAEGFGVRISLPSIHAS